MPLSKTVIRSSKSTVCSLSAQADELVANLQQGVQHIWEGALHKESIALEHKLDFAIVACTGVYKLADLCWQRDLPKRHRPYNVVVLDQTALMTTKVLGKQNHGNGFEAHALVEGLMPVCH